MDLHDHLNEQSIYFAESFDSTDSFYERYTAFLKEKGIIVDAEKIKSLFVKRESVQSTAIGRGVAAPHIFSDEFSKLVLSIAVIRQGMDFREPDNQPVVVIFLIMSDERDVGLPLKSLARIARLVQHTGFVAEAPRCRTAGELSRLLVSQEQTL